MSTKVIVCQTDHPMSSDEVDDVINGMPKRTYQALVQMINVFAQEYAMAAPQSASMNNALGMARDTGGYEALVNLITELDNRRSTSSSGE